MSSHISILGNIAINWVEDQPSIRPVRIRFEQDGIIRRLIDKLQGTNEQNAVESKEYEHPKGTLHRYVCLISRYPRETGIPPPNYSMPKYACNIKYEGASNPWDAIGDVYVGDIPDWLKAA